MMASIYLKTSKDPLMNYRYCYDKAIKLIDKYFKNKVDKGGHDYRGHLWRVANAIENEKEHNCEDKHSTLAYFYDKAIIVALLHDIVEDTEVTLDMLREEGFDEEIVSAIDAITRRKDEQYYFDFIERVKKNDIARIVKIYDLEDNMDIKRLSTFGDYEQKRLKKYWYCWKYLKGELGVMGAIVCNNNIHPDRKLR